MSWQQQDGAAHKLGEQIGVDLLGVDDLGCVGTVAIRGVGRQGSSAAGLQTNSGVDLLGVDTLGMGVEGGDFKWVKGGRGAYRGELGA